MRPGSTTDVILRESLGRLASRFERGERPSLGEVLDAFSAMGMKRNAFVALVVALPFLSPLSLGPIATPASLLILLLGWQLVQHREEAEALAVRQASWVWHVVAMPGRLVAWLVSMWPLRWLVTRLETSRDWMLAARLPRRIFGLMRHLLEWVLWFKNGLLRLRMWLWGARGLGHTTRCEATTRWICGVSIVVGAILLAVPVPLLPMTNTFPALGIILVALGWIERDALLTVLGYVAYLLSIVVFVALGVAVAYLGYEAVAAWMPSLLGFRVD